MQYGHFDNEKREYVIDRVDLPVSWTNYLGVKDMCVVVNHTAGGYMFYQTPEYHRDIMYISEIMRMTIIGVFPGSR